MQELNVRERERERERERNTAKRRWEFKEYFAAEDGVIIVDTRGAEDWFSGAVGIAEKSRFSSGNRLLQSTYSEGVKIADANRLINMSKPFTDGLVFIFMTIHPAYGRWRSGREWIKLRQKLESLQKGILTLSEASYDHLLVTPPSHFTPQKVKGYIVELTCDWRESTTTIL